MTAGTPRTLPPHVVARPVVGRQGGAGCPCPRLAAPASCLRSALRPSPWPRIAGRRGRGARGVCPAVRCRVCPAGFFSGLWGCLVASFSVLSSRSLVVSRGAAVAPLAAPWWRALVGSALSCGCAALAGSGVGAVVFRRGGGCRVPVGLGGGGVRVGLVGLVWVPAGGSPVCGSGLRCLRAGGRAALAAAGAARWRFPLRWRGRGPLSGGGVCCAGVAGAPALWRVCRLQRQFSHWQFKPWSCRCSHWDEIHQQRVIVQGGGFGFGPFVPAPAPIKHL